MRVLIIFAVVLAVSSVAFARNVDLRSKIANGGNRLIVLDFYATWCTSCVEIGPKVDELTTLHTDVTFIKINADENEEIGDAYKITNLPTFIFIKNGKELNRFSGAKYDQLKNTILRFK